MIRWPRGYDPNTGCERWQEYLRAVMGGAKYADPAAGKHVTTRTLKLLRALELDELSQDNKGTPT